MLLVNHRRSPMYFLIRRATMKAELKKTGDLGDIAMNCKSTQRLLFPPPPLTVRSLFKEFKSLAKMEVVFYTRIDCRERNHKTVKQV